MHHTFVVGDARERLAEIASQSVQCVVTSPPYFGLRDYGTASWEGGDPRCAHTQGRPGNRRADAADGLVENGMNRNRDGVGAMGGDCQNCGARRIDHQIGLEPTVEEYVAEMVAVFREVRRVLRDDGTLFLNLGDSYYGSTQTRGTNSKEGSAKRLGRMFSKPAPLTTTPILKPKDLIGVPWRVAFALQDDGWFLRSDIIWAKPNPMPESVRDRPTKAHEYIFLLTKSPSYFWDAEAVKEENTPDMQRRAASGHTRGPNGRVDASRHDGNTLRGAENMAITATGRNIRSVWTIATQPFPGAHFAVFPENLVEPCIKAGTSEKGACPTCGAPWARVVEREPDNTGYANGPGGSKRYQNVLNGGNGSSTLSDVARYKTTTTGWRPTCACPPHDPVPCVVLDPFGGSGTVSLVSDLLGRNSIYIDLNPEYALMAKNRVFTRGSWEMTYEKVGWT